MNSNNIRNSVLLVFGVGVLSAAGYTLFKKGQPSDYASSQESRDSVSNLDWSGNPDSNNDIGRQGGRSKKNKNRKNKSKKR